jgi:hypothetical protein
MNSMTYRFVSVFSGGEVGSISGSEVNQMQSRSAFVQLSASTYKQFGRPCRDIFSPGYEGEACHRMRLRRAPKVSHHGNGYWPLDGSPKRSGSNRLPRVRETHMTALASGVDWAEVSKTVGSTTAIVTVLGFLGQVAVKHLIHRDIDTHKSSLKRECDPSCRGKGSSGTATHHQ